MSYESVEDIITHYLDDRDDDIKYLYDNELISLNVLQNCIKERLDFAKDNISGDCCENDIKFLKNLKKILVPKPAILRT
jgi:hypothetical protein